ncbi:MAG: hypothetical protein AAF682_08985 [Planctomycetota bacterium]
MSSARVWIVILALTSFLAGSAAGLLGATRVSPPPPAVDRAPYADYVALLSRTYELEPERVIRLRRFLENYYRSVDELKSRHMGEVEDELIAFGETCRRQIRDLVLPEEHRASFDRDTAALLPDDSLSWAAPETGGE